MSDPSIIKSSSLSRKVDKRSSTTIVTFHSGRALVAPTKKLAQHSKEFERHLEKIAISDDRLYTFDTSNLADDESVWPFYISYVETGVIPALSADYVPDDNDNFPSQAALQYHYLCGLFLLGEQMEDRTIQDRACSTILSYYRSDTKHEVPSQTTVDRVYSRTFRDEGNPLRKLLVDIFVSGGMARDFEILPETPWSHHEQFLEELNTAVTKRVMLGDRKRKAGVARFLMGQLREIKEIGPVPVAPYGTKSCDYHQHGVWDRCDG